ncbi:MAG: SDR family NAD(P)-dependent oxidoreductase [Proteobacteria bacterium]|nr:SDR family NAD(P)-dependent oxidoreductase [Pseudomonadota bacterium]
MHDLSGKTILVTGASKGIGAATVRQLGACGAFVVSHYSSDRNGAEEACKDIAIPKKLLVEANFEDLDQVEALWDTAMGWRGRIDVLVNNAAIMLWDGGFEETLDAWDTAWEKTLRVNVLAPARLLRRAVKYFKEENGGIVITLSSWAAQKGVTNPSTIAYGSSKAAIQAATQTIARAFAKDGILAYVIAPGVVRTRLSDQFAATQGGADNISSALAMGEWVPPEELAELITYLARGRARHLSGATLDVNGASYIR